MYCIILLRGCQNVKRVWELFCVFTYLPPVMLHYVILKNNVFYIILRVAFILCFYFYTNLFQQIVFIMQPPSRPEGPRHWPGRGNAGEHLHFSRLFGYTGYYRLLHVTTGQGVLTWGSASCRICLTKCASGVRNVKFLTAKNA